MDLLKRLENALAAEAEKHFLENSRKLFDETAVEYKHRLSGKFVLTDPSKISEIEGSNICITRKLDGEMRTVYFDGSTTVMFTTGGKEERDFPCLTEFTQKLKAAGIKCAGFAAELNFVKADGSRSRVSDVIHAVTNEELHGSLALSPFDILFIDDSKWQAEHYEKTYEKMKEIFGVTGPSTPLRDRKGMLRDHGLVCPVQMEMGTSSSDIAKVYKKWVLKEKAEGLVVHTEQPVIWKIKPLHSIDAAVVGYTSYEKGVRDLLFAVMEPSGIYRIFASGSNGLSDKQLKILEQNLSALKVSSNLIYTDSQGVAFQMIKPEFVFEITATDFANTNCLNDSFKNYILEYSDKKGWNMKGKVPGVATYNLSIVRLREDKKCLEPDIAVHQLQDLCPFPNAEKSIKPEKLSDSTIIERKVFFKQIGKRKYVKKFVLLKTNKEKTELYSKYILHFTDFSSGRAEKMKISVWPSSSKTELLEKMEKLIYISIKSGWATQ